MIVISLNKTLQSDAKTVCGLLLAHEKLARFFNAKFSVIKQQNPGELPGGKGTIRQVIMGGSSFQEEIMSAELNHIRYQIIGKGPVNNHQGNIYISTSKTRNCVDINYQITCCGPFWLPDFLLQAFIKKDIAGALNKLEHHINCINNDLEKKEL